MLFSGILVYYTSGALQVSPNILPRGPPGYIRPNPPLCATRSLVGDSASRHFLDSIILFPWLAWSRMACEANDPQGDSSHSFASHMPRALTALRMTLFEWHLMNSQSYRSIIWKVYSPHYPYAVWSPHTIPVVARSSGGFTRAELGHVFSPRGFWMWPSVIGYNEWVRIPPRRFARWAWVSSPAHKS